MSDEQFEVEYMDSEKEVYVEPESEEMIDESGTEVRIARLPDGRWLAWMPDKESSLNNDTKRAKADGKYLAAGAIRHYYYCKEREDDTFFD